MDNAFQEILAGDSDLSRYMSLNYTNTPMQHFWGSPPYHTFVDFMSHPSKVAFYNHLMNYKYSNATGIVTQRGYSKKWQISIDLHTGDTIEENQEGTHPWRDFYDALELKNIWYNNICPQAYTTWFPALYPGASLLAKKLRITYVKDTISSKDQFQHPLERSESDVLLSAHVHVFSPIATWVDVKCSGEVKSRTLAHPGSAIITAPQRNPYTYRLFTSDSYEDGDTFSKDVIDDSHTMYLKFDFIE